MSLTDQIAAILAKINEFPEELRNPILKANAQFQDSFDPRTAIQIGQTIPEFRLPNAVDEEVSSADLLSQGPLLITFYRGTWCPFCDLAVAALQKHLDEFKARRVTLVAITPELPDFSLSMTEKHNLRFPVLTDRGNAYAEKLGLLFRMPDSLRPIFDRIEHGLKGHNGDDSFTVPIPATILVDKEGVVRNAFIDPDYTKRLEPAVAIEWIDALNH
ncbi:peroxiredoxin-like family protein [Aspergillus lucknowensis]|uniref:thioredoxin-dependent peroxiredoxin n=1 Tax=Aspergillus lucknowensis TaxID=176173 RepID=A0ABR4LUH4_9EURO